jgi:hypothetical protein
VAIEPGADRVQKLGAGKWLGDVVVRAELHPGADVRAIGPGGDEDERQVRRVGIAPEHAQHLEAVHLRHGDVAEHEIERGRPRLGDPAPTVRGRHAFEALRVQKVQHVGADGGIVLDHQDAFHERPPTGMTTENVVPFPSSLSTEMRPPCTSTEAFTTASPRPVPATFPTLDAR